MPGPLDEFLADHSIGNPYLDVLTDPHWVHRQVENLSIESDGVTRRSASIDATLPSALPPWTAPTGGVEGTETNQSVVPLGLLVKSTIHRLDASVDGKTAPILSTPQNARVSSLFLLASLERTRLGFELAAQPLSDEETASLRQLAIDVVSYSPSDVGSGVPTPPDVYSAFQAVLDGRTLPADLVEDVVLLVRYFETFIDTFLLLAAIPAEAQGQRVILKYSLDTTFEIPASTSIECVRLDYTLPISIFWPNASLHFGFNGPSELRVRSVQTDVGARVPRVPRERSAHLVWPATGQGIGRQQDSRSEHRISLEVTAAAQGIRSFTTWALSAVTAMCFFVLIARATGWFTDPSKPVSGSASLVLVAPALLLSWLARTPEHELVARCLSPLRKALIACAVILFATALLAALPFWPWVAAFAWPVLAASAAWMLIDHLAWTRLN